MALASVSCKTVSRGAGRSATAAAAYRTGERITDMRTGEVHDYRRRSGVDHVSMHLPMGAPTMTTGQLWNKVEASETRKNSTVARELVVALPHELNLEQRRELAERIADQLVERYHVAVQVAVHLPDSEGDQRNHHAHIMFSTRQMDANGNFGGKTRQLDDLKTGPQEVLWMRGMVEIEANFGLERAGSAERIDMRSLADQRAAALDVGDVDRAAELDRPATLHEGPRVTQIKREAARYGRMPLGALDRAAANDHRHQLGRDRAELRQVSAQILDFEKARVLRDVRAKEEVPLTGSAKLRARIAQLGGGVETSREVPVDAFGIREWMAARTDDRPQRLSGKPSVAPVVTSPKIEPAPQPKPELAPLVQPVERQPNAAEVELKALKAGLVPVARLVAANPKVIETKAELARLEAEVAKAKDWVFEIPEKVAEWRAEHPWLAGLHDKGLKKSPELRYFEKSLAKVQFTLSNAGSWLDDLKRKVSSAESRALDNIYMERRLIASRIEVLEVAVRREMAPDDVAGGTLQGAPEKRRRAPLRLSEGPVRHSSERDEPGMGMD